MTPVQITGTLIAEWRATRYPYKLIAAQIAEWALTQPHGTELPPNDYFAGDLPIVASPTTWNRAKQFLSQAGTLYQNDGPYKVT